MAIADVTILGAGVFGLACGFEAARRGARVRVIDPHGVGAGASGGIVGALAPHVPERWNDKKAFQFASLIAARSFWPAVEAAGGRASGYGATGRLQPVANERALLRAQARAAEAADLWQGKAHWQLIKVEAAGGFAPASTSGWIIHDTLSARIHPRQACHALAAAIAALGGEIVTEGKHEGRILHATGAAGLADLGAALGRPMGSAEKGQALLLAYDAGPRAPQVFVDGVHFIPHADGSLAIGSTSERAYQSPDRTDHLLDALADKARALMPHIAGAEVLERWAGLRPRATSRAPLLGAWPDRAGHFIANGGFKIGFGMAPRVAQVMADLMFDGHDAIPAEFRIAPA